MDRRRVDQVLEVLWCGERPDGEADAGRARDGEEEVDDELLVVPPHLDGDGADGLGRVLVRLAEGLGGLECLARAGDADVAQQRGRRRVGAGQGARESEGRVLLIVGRQEGQDVVPQLCREQAGRASRHRREWSRPER